MDLVQPLSKALDVPEAGIKLLLTLYSGFIVSSVHQLFLSKLKVTVQHIYVIITSLALLYWNYEEDIFHILFTIVVQWAIFFILGTSIFSTSVSFIFQMGYLIFGYLYCSTSDYDMNWLIPQCVLTLRLIGLAFDVYDGHRKESDLSADQKQHAVHDIPSLIEVLGFSLFYGGFMIGPQFSFVRLRALLNGKLMEQHVPFGVRFLVGMQRGLLGTLLLGVQAYLASTFNPQFYLTHEFQMQYPFWKKVGYVSATGQVTLFRYVCIWMVAEGSCIISGLSYRKDAAGAVHWDAMRNVHLRKYLSAGSFQDIIESFNVNTNGWVMRYVFKRLKFMNNRTISHVSALYFLAVWHGLHVGYFTCFAYEFMLMSAEKPMMKLLNESAFVNQLRSSQYLVVSWLPSLCSWLYLHTLLGYCVIDFTLMHWRIYIPIYNSIYWHGHVFYLGLNIALKLRSLLSTDKKKAE